VTDSILLVAVVAVPLGAALVSLVCSLRFQIAIALLFQVVAFGLALTVIARVLQVGHIGAFAHWLYLDLSLIHI